ncbi:MAG: hypothetical protein Q8P81_02555 [Nanoarchaeota archaeon]|nr:hypothetical protein [Nanoarchaeota archaeon]
MTGNRFSNLCNIWNSIGPFNMNSFSDRLILQKKIYLLSELGFDLGYNFRKYIRGPYSSELASDGYKMEVANAISPKGEIPKELLDKLEILGEGHERDPLWFELIASILFLLKKERLSLEKCREKISNEKPHLDVERDFDNVLSRLKKIGLLN